MVGRMDGGSWVLGWDVKERRFLKTIVPWCPWLKREEKPMGKRVTKIRMTRVDASCC
jgi:hypothetical protein